MDEKTLFIRLSNKQRHRLYTAYMRFPGPIWVRGVVGEQDIVVEGIRAVDDSKHDVVIDVDGNSKVPAQIREKIADSLKELIERYPNRSYGNLIRDAMESVNDGIRITRDVSDYQLLAGLRVLLRRSEPDDPEF